MQIIIILKIQKENLYKFFFQAKRKIYMKKKSDSANKEEGNLCCGIMYFQFIFYFFILYNVKKIFLHKFNV